MCENATQSADLSRAPCKGHFLPDLMMDEKKSVTKLIAELRSSNPAGRSDAAALLWKRYWRAMFKVASENLANTVKPRVDEYDVLQTMYKSLVLRLGGGQYEWLQNRKHLLRLMKEMTRNKAREAGRHVMRKGRSPKREQPTVGRNAEGVEVDLIAALADRSLPPDAEARAFQEELDYRLSILDAECQQIVRWKLEGLTNAQIAEKMDRTLRTVERKLERIHGLWKEQD
jgi:RNA polymerase sigma factor (sigma-70 family)